MNGVKLPRWMVGTLLSISSLGAAAVLGIAWWSWIAWPTQTAEDFVARLGVGDEHAWEIFAYPDAYASGDRTFQPQWEPRTIGDFVCGRRRFWLSGCVYVFVAERGGVRYGNEWREVGNTTTSDEDYIWRPNRWSQTGTSLSRHAASLQEGL